MRFKEYLQELSQKEKIFKQKIEKSLKSFDSTVDTKPFIDNIFDFSKFGMYAVIVVQPGDIRRLVNHLIRDFGQDKVFSKKSAVQVYA